MLINVTQTWETVDSARRAPWKRKMKESASHHEFTFSFAQLRADSLKKSANRCRREHKCSKIGNFTNLRKHPLALELTLYPSTLTIETTSE